MTIRVGGTNDAERSASAILIDSGISISQLKTGDYSRLLEAMSNGEIVKFGSKDATGKYSVIIDGGETEADDNCPSWMPKSLCGGFSAVSKYGMLATPGGALAMAAQGGNSYVADYLSWAVRIALFSIAVILIAVALVYTFKDEAVELALGSVTKALK